MAARWFFLFLLMGVGAAHGALAQEGPVRKFQVLTPKPFGYFIGDTIRHEIHAEIAKPYRLDKSSIPAKGRLGYWLELSDVAVDETDRDSVWDYRITLTYQTFYAPLEVKALDIPGFLIIFRAGAERYEKKVQPWTFTASPLRELRLRGVSEGEQGGGTVYIRPDEPPRFISGAALRLRLIGLGGATLTVLFFVLYEYGIWPFGRRTARPFVHARRKIRALLREGDDAAVYGQAVRSLHEAFNATNGTPVFPEALDVFLARHKAYAPLRSEIESFFAASRQFFFGSNAEAAQRILPLAGLAVLAARLSEKERPV